MLEGAIDDGDGDAAITGANVVVIGGASGNNVGLFVGTTAGVKVGDVGAVLLIVRSTI